LGGGEQKRKHQIQPKTKLRKIWPTKLECLGHQKKKKILNRKGLNNKKTDRMWGKKKTLKKRKKRGEGVLGKWGGQTHFTF